MKLLSPRIFSERVLVATPFGRDADMLCRVLRAQDFEPEACPKIPDLIEKLGEGAGVILITEEVLNSKEGQQLFEFLKTQESWSTIPILAFYGQRTGADEAQKRALHPFQAHTDITFLERPVSTMTLVSATRSALRDRARQYQVRDLLQQLQEDISEKERHEVLLRAAKRSAEDANQSKSQFLANMSHEIRTPLGAIIGFAELMQDGHQDEGDQRECLETIIRNSRQLANLVNDLLDISKVEAGRMEVEIVEFPLTDMVLEVEKLFDGMAQKQGLGLSFEFVSPFPQRIFSDPTRLRQILVNLIGNAIKFTSKGKVTVRVELMTSDSALEESDVLVKVSDSGPGMSMQEQKRIFSSFVQGDASTTRKYGGTGLGLSLSKQLAKLLGGDLYIDQSEVGVGTTMALRIASGLSPARKTNLVRSTVSSIEGEAGSAEVKELPLEGLVVLLVEDTKDNQVLVSRLLERRGAKVHFANDGHEGVQKALDGGYHLVLMDIQMPNKDGYEATRELRDLGYNGPVIALTAHAMREDRAKTEQAGFSGYLTKPVNRKELIATVAAHCKQSV